MKYAIKALFKFIRLTSEFIFFLCNLIAHRGFTNPFKNKYKGTVAILANGPSLNEVLPRLETGEEFKNVDFLALNFFALEDIFSRIKPTHYCLADPMFFKENHRPERSDDIRKLFYILQNNVDWDLQLYIPRHFAKNSVCSGAITNKKITVIVVNCIEYKGYEFLRNIFYKKGLSAPYVITVANMAIFTAINLRYDKVLLYGFDHTFFDFLVDDRNRFCYKSTHFYDKGKISYQPMLNGDRSQVKISRYLEYVTHLFKSHDYLAAYAKYMHTKIFNCTSCSLIDSYERTSN